MSTEEYFSTATRSLSTIITGPDDDRWQFHNRAALDDEVAAPPATRSTWRGASRLLRRVAILLDLLDRHGRPDYNKILPFIAIQQLALVLVWDVVINGNAIDAWLAAIIAMLAVGWSALRMALIRRAAGSDAEDLRREVRVILEETRRLVDAAQVSVLMHASVGRPTTYRKG